MHKFPRTRHLFDAGEDDVSREDLLYAEEEGNKLFLSGKHDVVIEEKVDGANIGFSIAEDGHVLAQNRSHFVNSSTHPQFKHIDEWISKHIEELYDICKGPQQFVLFGEWLFARHSVEYNALPDVFIAFDIYDVKADKFLSRKDFHARMKNTSFAVVPTLATKPLKSRDDVREMLEMQSSFGDGKIEGVYLRVDEDHLPTKAEGEEKPKEGDAEAAVSYLAYRSKVVRPDFMQGITEHWDGHGAHSMKLNTVKYPEE